MEQINLEKLYLLLPEYVQTITKKRKGKMYNCPLCHSGAREHGTPAFNLYAENNTRCHCHSCGFDGNIIGLYMAVNNMEDTQSNVSVAITALAKMFGLATTQSKSEWKPTGKLEKRTHYYKYPDGSVFGYKEIVSYTDGSKKAIWNLYLPEEKRYQVGLKDKKAPLYHADLLAQNPSDPVFVTEGEKDADTIYNYDGSLSTTIPNGAGFSQWLDCYSDGLRNREVIILTDNDEAGRAYGEKVAHHALNIAKSVKVIPITAIWKECPEKGDISDAFKALGADETAERLSRAVGATAFYQSSTQNESEPQQLSVDEQEIVPLTAKKGYEFEKKTIRYIWYPYIPAGDYTVLMAAGGTGKTYFACGVAATISRGESLPIPSEYEHKKTIQENQNVLMISAEDRGSDIWERLEKSGADVEHIRIVDKSSSTDFQFPKNGSDTLRIKILEKTIEEYNPNLIIIDPWHAFCPPEIDVNRINHVRPVFQTLSAICEKYDCGLILISHVNKKPQENANNAALGSVDLVNASRSTLTVISDSRDKNSRIVIHTKSNHAPHGQSVKFEIDDNGFSWNGFEPNITKDTLEEAARMHRKPAEMVKETPDYSEMKDILLEIITDLVETGKENKIAYRQLDSMYDNDDFRTLPPIKKKELIEQLANTEAFKSRGMTLVGYATSCKYEDNITGKTGYGRGIIISCMVTGSEMASAMPKKK